MKAVEIFDVCHGRYRGLREWLDDSAGAVRSVDLEKPSERLSLAAWPRARLRICRRFRAHRAPRAAPRGMEGASEAFQYLFCAQRRIPTRNFTRWRS